MKDPLSRVGHTHTNTQTNIRVRLRMRKPSPLAIAIDDEDPTSGGWKAPHSETDQFFGMEEPGSDLSAC